MPNYTTQIATAQAFPERREIEVINDLAGRQLAYDQGGLFWVWAKVRRKAYVCSQGVMHRVYWRTMWRQGRDDLYMCEEHEATVTRP